MSIFPPNYIIKDYFSEIRKLLFIEDGRTDLPPENLLDFKEVNIEDAEEIRSSEPNKNSLIKLSPNKSISEFIQYRSDFHNYYPELESYDKDFLKLPIDTIEISEEIEIDCYFYKYSFMDRNDILLQVQAPNISAGNFLMRRSDFLYMTIYSKLVSISDNYQNCLKEGIDQFQLNENVDEENILHHFIKYYTEILNIDDKQLRIFEHVKTTKQIADIYTKILIEFLTLKLNILSPETDKYYITQPQGMCVDEKNEEKIVIELPKNFAFEDLKIKSTVINAKQTVILFHYLRKYDAIIDHSNASYALLVNLLTGYSHKQLRTTKGFGNITGILGKTIKGVKSANLKAVKTLLEKILSDIDKKISEQA